MGVAKKVISVAFFAALFLSIQILPVYAARPQSVTINFSQQSFSCLASISNADNVDITKSVSVRRVTEHGREYSLFDTPVEYARYAKLFTFDLYGLKLKTDTDYQFSFPFFQNYTSPTSVFVQIYFKNTATGTTEHFEVVNVESKSLNYAYDNVFTGTVHTPSISGSYQVNLLVMLSSDGGNSAVSQKFWFGDCSFVLDSPLYGDHYEGDTSDIDDINNQIEAIEGQLPNMDDVDLSGLLDPSQLDAYINGFEAVNASFGRIVDAFELAPIILFSLAIGLCNYLLGRRLSS